jgi:hypothetical protein
MGRQHLIVYHAEGLAGFYNQMGDVHRHAIQVNMPIKEHVLHVILHVLNVRGRVKQTASLVTPPAFCTIDKSVYRLAQVAQYKVTIFVLIVQPIVMNVTLMEQRAHDVLTILCYKMDYAMWKQQHTLWRPWMAPLRLYIL